MKRIAGSLLAVSLLLGGNAFAHQPPLPPDHGHGHDHRDPHRYHEAHRHPPRPGERLAQDHRGSRVPDYRHHGLKRPPRGHEWRKVDDTYVLVAVATGIIASVIAAHH